MVISFLVVLNGLLMNVLRLSMLLKIGFVLMGVRVRIWLNIFWFFVEYFFEIDMIRNVCLFVSNVFPFFFYLFI